MKRGPHVLVVVMLALVGMMASPAFAQQAPAKLDRTEMQALQSRESATLRDMRGGTQQLNVPGLTAHERRILDEHSAMIRDVLAAYRGGDMETGLSVTWWILIGCGIAAGVALLIILILLFSL